MTKFFIRMMAGALATQKEPQPQCLHELLESLHI